MTVRDVCYFIHFVFSIFLFLWFDFCDLLLKCFYIQIVHHYCCGTQFHFFYICSIACSAQWFIINILPLGESVMVDYHTKKKYHMETCRGWYFFWVWYFFLSVVIYNIIKPIQEIHGRFYIQIWTYHIHKYCESY